MQSPSLLFVASALLALAAGCSSVNNAQNARYARLPTGVTLLDTDTGRCDGTVQVREEHSGRNRNPEIALKPGENATFEIDPRDGDRLEWSCIGGQSSSSARVDCPDDTSHVRITRTAERGDLTLECYGTRRRG